MTIPVLTLSEMKEVERRTATEYGLSEYEMILSAGEAVFETIKTMLEPPNEEDSYDEMDEDELEVDEDGEPDEEESEDAAEKLIAFVCGKGNNGADGLAAALLVMQSGLSVVIYQLHSETPYSQEVQKLQQQLLEVGMTINFIKSPLDLPVFQNTSLIVDGLLGSGIKKDPEGILQSCIFGMNQSRVPILAIDIPSGIYCDSSRLADSTVQADATVCLGALKLSSVFFPSSLAFGKVGYSPICFDEKLLSSQASHMHLYTLDDAAEDLPYRTYRDNKYTVGKVLIIAGSRGMHGAAVLAAKAAMRAGAGMVKIAVPGGIFVQVSSQMMEVITIPVGENAMSFTSQHLSELAPFLDWADSLLVGPGLGKSEETRKFLDLLLGEIKLPVVVDGDGLVLFEREQGHGASSRSYANFVATPHAGEYRRMGGEYNYEQPVELLENLRNLAISHRLNIVLKGPTSFYSNLEGKMLILPVGNPGMASAGMGDVLAGVVAAFMGLKPPDQAAPLAVHIHGKAGDLARDKNGTLGLIASDVIEMLPSAIREIEERDDESQEPGPSAAPSN